MTGLGFDFMEYSTEDRITGRCLECKSAKIVRALGGWSFVGCYHQPYRGKWTAEIKDCPKGNEHE